MNEQKQYVCPWCGGKDVVEGIQSTYDCFLLGTL